MSTQPYLDDAAAGTELPALVKEPTTRQLVMYAGASGDFYEIHYDKDFAAEQGLPGVILHGALKSAYLGQLVTDWAGAEGRLLSLSVRYREMDVPATCSRARGPWWSTTRRQAPCAATSGSRTAQASAPPPARRLSPSPRASSIPSPTPRASAPSG